MNRGIPNLETNLRRICITAVFALTVLPLVVDTNLIVPFVTSKVYFFRIVVEVAFACWVILAWIRPSYLKLNTVSILVLSVAGLVLIADLVGVDVTQSFWSNFTRMDGFVTFIHVVALYVVVSSVFGNWDSNLTLWRKWFISWICVSTVVSILGLLQVIGVVPIDGSTVRIDATLGNAEYFAIYLLVSIGLAAYLLVISKKKFSWKGIGLSASTILFLINLYFTGTRGVIVGLLFGIFLACLLYAFFAPRTHLCRRMYCGGALLVMVLLMLALWFSRNTTFVQHQSTLVRLTAISWSNTSDQARQYIWPMALFGVLERPFFGWGQGNFTYVFQNHYNPLMYSDEQWFDRTHNVFLDWLVSAGIIGFLAYVLLYVFYFKNIWNSRLSIAERSVLIGLMGAFVIANFFTFETLSASLAFIMLVAFSSGTVEHKPVRVYKVSWIPISITVVVLTAIMYFVNIRSFIANAELAHSLDSCGNVNPDTISFEHSLSGPLESYRDAREQILQCAPTVIANPTVASSTKQTFSELTVKSVNEEVGMFRNDAQTYALVGAFLDQIGDYAHAESYLEEARRLMPGKETIAFELGVNYLHQNRTAEAVALFRSVVVSAPAYLRAEQAYALARIIENPKNDPNYIEQTNVPLFKNARQEVAAGNGSDVIHMLQVLISNSSNPDTLLAWARMEYSAGQVTQAIETLHEIAREHPEYKQAVDSAIAETIGRP